MKKLIFCCLLITLLSSTVSGLAYGAGSHSNNESNYVCIHPSYDEWPDKEEPDKR
jgi:hypothetical protein